MTTHRSLIRRPSSRLAGLVAVALALLGATAAQAAPAGKVELRLLPGGSAAKSLRTQGVTVQAISPASLSGELLTLPLARLSAGAPMVLVHRGGLRLRSGTRSAVLRAFRIKLGRTAAISARLGGGRRRLLALDIGERRPQIDRARGTARLLGARLLVTRKGAAALKRALGLERLSPGTLARASVRLRFPAQGPKPSPSPDPRPEQLPPALSQTQWESSHLAGCSSCDHKSFIKYILGGPPGSGVGASVTPSAGAGWMHPEADPNRPFDFELPVVSSSTTAGVTTVQHGGQIRYSKPQHFLDNQIRNLAFEIPSIGSTGRVLADGQHSAMANPTDPPVTYTGEHVLNLDFTGVTPTPVAGGLTYTDVPATVAESGQEELSYATGKPWGRFTITVPVQ